MERGNQTVSFSDAWLLFACAKGEGNLAKTIGVADAMNHAIPTPEEWRHAMARLGMKGLVTFQTTGPILTDLGFQLVEQQNGWNITAIRDLIPKIEALPIIGEPVPPPGIFELTAAYDEYQITFNTILQRLRDGRQE